MTFAWEDARILSGMEQQLRARRRLLSSGGKPLGWKLAFGGPAAMARLRINAPLVGFLMESAVVPSGSTISLEGWKKPAAEPELALYMGRDLAADADRDTAIAAIARLGAAIEVADVDHPSEDVKGTLVRNIYQRHVILGSSRPTESTKLLTGLRARVFRNDEELADTSDFEALTGELIDIVRHIANLLKVFGEKLEAGQMIIAGSITPPIWVEPGEQIRFELVPLAAISVGFEPRRQG
jgi:2-keto-4-pentenoate hydratase